MTVSQREHKKTLLAQAHEESKQGPHRVVVRGPPWALKKVILTSTTAPLPAQSTQKSAATPAVEQTVNYPVAKTGYKKPAPRWFTHQEEPAPNNQVTSPIRGASAF